ncbi:succinate dehydrogenase, partial [Schumannella luteola]
ALIHGSNGMRTLINDYAHGRFRTLLLWALGATTVVLLVLGTLVLTTFDPCIGGTDNAEFAAICAAAQ